MRVAVPWRGDGGLGGSRAGFPRTCSPLSPPTHPLTCAIISALRSYGIPMAITRSVMYVRSSCATALAQFGSPGAGVRPRMALMPFFSSSSSVSAGVVAFRAGGSVVPVPFGSDPCGPRWLVAIPIVFSCSFKLAAASSACSFSLFACSIALAFTCGGGGGGGGGGSGGGGGEEAHPRGTQASASADGRSGGCNRWPPVQHPVQPALAVPVVAAPASATPEPVGARAALFRSQNQTGSAGRVALGRSGPGRTSSPFACI